MKINHPMASKINWTAFMMACVGAAVALDVIPQEAEEPVTELTLIFGPVLVATFRTWFTEK